MILPPSHPLRIISAVPPLSNLFARALCSSAPARVGGARPPRAPQGPSHFVDRGRARDGGRRDEDGRSYGMVRNQEDRGRQGEGRSLMQYKDDRRRPTERGSGSSGYGVSRVGSEGGERTSRRLADLPRHPPSRSSTTTPTSLSFAKPSSAASAHEAAPQLFSNLDLPSAALGGLIDVLGHDSSKTTPIQTLAYRHMITSSASTDGKGQGWVLGAETGSGKTLAYLVPMMHQLKQSEPSAVHTGAEQEGTVSTIRPRAMVLSPTHELTRQSTSVAKTLSHSIKLRVKGLSSTRWGSVDAQTGTDVLLGTTGSVRKLLGLGRDGEKWAADEGKKGDKRDQLKEIINGEDAELDGVSVGRSNVEAGPKLGMEDVEWLVIDEADVLLGPDFAPETRAILSTLPSSTSIVLCTATLPPSLLSALSAPPLSSRTFTHLISPGMHRLPSGLKTKFISDTGGNLAASVAAEVRKAFEEDNLQAGVGEKGQSKAVVFCNTDSRVRQISRKFTEKGLGTLCWTSKGPEGDETVNGKGRGVRQRGKQGELSAFLSSFTNKLTPPSTDNDARVLVTTSLLSRGLDFSADISTVILVDPPRDALDFVHRAGRTGRAGRKGRVVVFGMGGKDNVKGFSNKGRGGLKGRIGEEVSRVIRQRK